MTKGGEKAALRSDGKGTPDFSNTTVRKTLNLNQGKQMKITTEIVKKPALKSKKITKITKTKKSDDKKRATAI